MPLEAVEWKYVVQVTITGRFDMYAKVHKPRFFHLSCMSNSPNYNALSADISFDLAVYVVLKRRLLDVHSVILFLQSKIDGDIFYSRAYVHVCYGGMRSNDNLQ